MRVLGIETSCDETAAAIVDADLSPDGAGGGPGPGHVIANVIAGQFTEHAAFGGVVPEIAARAHIEKLDLAIAEALRQADSAIDEIDAVAATAGPGLIGGVMVGLTTAKAIAMATARPLLAINHLEGHALTARLTDRIEFPYLLLLVSGGHTQILMVEGLGSYRRLGTTIDDAVGEAFDKTAKLMGLPQPGGPAVQEAAQTGDSSRFALPKPLLDRTGLDFSFAGLKTAVRQAAERSAPLTDQDVADLCASFQRTVAQILSTKIDRALKAWSHPTSPRLVAAGGVAANTEIRAGLAEVAARHDAQLVLPPLALCTDNAAMIAWAGIEHLAAGNTAPLSFAPRARWPLDITAAPRVGYGRLGTKV